MASGIWDTPPTKEEMESVWATPPTEEERRAARTQQDEALSPYEQLLFAEQSGNTEFAEKLRSEIIGNQNLPTLGLADRASIGAREPETQLQFIRENKLPEGWKAHPLADGVIGIFDETGTPVQLTNRPGLDAGDVAESAFDLAGGVVEGISGAAGAGVGFAAGGPPGAVAGGVLGAGLGGAAVEGVRQAISPGPFEIGDVLKEGAFSAAGEGLTLGAFSLAKAGLRKFSKFRLPDDALKRTLEKVGPNVDLDQVGKEVMFFQNERIRQVRKAAQEEVEAIRKEALPTPSKPAGRKALRDQTETPVRPRAVSQTLRALNKTDTGELWGSGVDVRGLRRRLLGPVKKIRGADGKTLRTREGAPLEEVIQVYNDLGKLRPKNPEGDRVIEALREAIRRDMRAATAFRGAAPGGRGEPLQRIEQVLSRAADTEALLKREFLGEILQKTLAKDQVAGEILSQAAIENGGRKAISLLASPSVDETAIHRAIRTLEHLDPSLAQQTKRAVLDRLFSRGIAEATPETLKRAETVLGWGSREQEVIETLMELKKLVPTAGDRLLSEIGRGVVKRLPIPLRNKLSRMISSPGGVVLNPKTAPRLRAMAEAIKREEWAAADRQALRILNSWKLPNPSTVFRETTARAVEEGLEGIVSSGEN